MTVREAAWADIEALATLHRLAFETPWDAQALTALLGTPGVHAFLAQTDQGPNGFILCRAAGGESEILTLATAPTCRRQGVARALLAAAMQSARARGAEAMFLEVARDNRAALALYEQAGFDQVGERRGYYARDGAAVDALVLRRALNTSTP